MKALILGAAVVALGLALLLTEALRVRRLHRSISVRVCVTGTRGKSSVVRLLAAALRAGGLRVVAKTTGSLPCLLLPDGSERVLRRLGPPSILEQKRLLREARRAGADALVAEIMSISPETQFVESRRILGATHCLITNIRVDHRETLGATRQTAARALALSVPAGGTVLCPEGDCLPPVEEAASRLGARLIRVPASLPAGYGAASARLPYREFEANLSLALAAAAELGVSAETALRGMREVRPDVGALRAWRVPTDTGFLVAINAFAANDPESTRRVIASLGLRREGGPVTGVLALRRDRGDRTLQWIEALCGDPGGTGGLFDRLLLVGSPAPAVRRWLGLPRSAVCGGWRPERAVMDALARTGGTAIGFGNIGGAGLRLVRLWERKGTAYEL